MLVNGACPLYRERDPKSVPDKHIAIPGVQRTWRSLFVKYEHVSIHHGQNAAACLTGHPDAQKTQGRPIGPKTLAKDRA